MQAKDKMVASQDLVNLLEQFMGLAEIFSFPSFSE